MPPDDKDPYNLARWGMALGTLAGIGQFTSGLRRSRGLQRQANLTRRTAREVKRAGERRVQQRQGDVRREVASQRTAFAGQGVDLQGGGVVQQLRQSAEAVSDADIIRIRTQAAREARAQKLRAKTIDEQADLARKAAGYNAFGTIAGTFLNYQALQ
jgi:hypothetical protein